MNPQDINILVGCEESQAVCKAFRTRGFNAFSCDILPCSGGHPEWHINVDVLTVIKGGIFTTQSGDIVIIYNWQLIISFPPCTDLSLSGAKHFEKKRNDGRQEKSIRFFFEIWKISHCTENPMGTINGGKYISNWFPNLFKQMLEAGFPFKPSQIVQPYMFGDPVKKTTCLWLSELPILNPKNDVKKDVYDNDMQQLSECAEMLLAVEHEEGIDSASFPSGWDHDTCYKMLCKSYYDRLIIAGALIAAEIDRLNNTDEL